MESITFFGSFSSIISSQKLSAKSSINEEIKSRLFHDTVSEIRKQGGLVICPHPFDRLRKTAFHPRSVHVRYFDGIEVFNSRCVFKSDNEKALRYAIHNNKSILAGSDAHYANEIGNAVTFADNNLWSDIIAKKTYTRGKKSSFMNHVKTKMLKIRRKI